MSDGFGVENAMNNIAEELRDIADKAEAGDKLHWAKAMRAGALQLYNWQRDLETYRLRLDHHDAQSAQLGEVLEENKRLRAIEAAARNLCEVRGRHHSEIAMRRLIEALTPNAGVTGA